MVTQYGMSEKFGLMGLEARRTVSYRPYCIKLRRCYSSRYRPGSYEDPENAYDEAKRLLRDDREAMDKIAAFLIEKETITGKEFMKNLP